MIETFADKETARIFGGEVSRKLPAAIQEGARETLVLLASIGRIEDLWAFPSLKAKKVGKGWSLRVNDQWRITFFWNPVTAAATQVRIEDYH